MTIDQFNFHCYWTEKADSSKLAESIFEILRTSKYKLIPIFEEYESMLKARLRKFNLDSSEDYIDQSNWTLLFNKKNTVLLYLAFLPGGNGFDIKIFAKSYKIAKNIANHFLKIKKIRKIHSCGLIDKKLAQEVDNKLKAVSPNGKMIADKQFHPIIEKLYIDKIRNVVKKIANVYAETPIPIEYINRIKVRKKIIKQLISDDDLIEKNYKPVCKKCELPSNFIFNKYEEATRSLKKAKYKCPNCNNTTFEITRVYSLTEKCINSIRSGIWLEKLAMDVIKSVADVYWCCRVYDNNEYDGVTIYNNKIIFIECKNTGFGQNALYSALIKADEINANIVLIITTEKVHQNVTNAIEKFEKKSDRKFCLIVSNKVPVIKKELVNFFRPKARKDIKEFVGSQKSILRRGLRRAFVRKKGS